ncbi:MAG: HNH endonuclease [Spirochaetaceae bacterium]|nr:HNH endonuclease [Spirochaetaceae bacterium]
MIDAAGRELASTVSALSDDRLLEQTTKLALLDHQVQVFVIDHLLEIQARGLYLSRGYGNLFAYVTRGLGYSDGAAWRRIAAMKLCARIEGTRDRLRDGSLTLDAAAQLQAAFERRDREQARLARGAKAGTAGAAKPNGRATSTPAHPPERKPAPVLDLSARKALVEQAAGKSTRQVMQMLAAVDPALAVPADRMRPLSEGRWELKAVVDEECQRGLEQLKGLLSHVDPRMTLGQLVGRLVRDGLDRYDPSRPPRRRANRTPASAAERTSAPKGEAPSDGDVPAVEQTAKRDATAWATGDRTAWHDIATAPPDPEPIQPSRDHEIPAVAPAEGPLTRTATRRATVPASAPKPPTPPPTPGSSPSKAPGNPDPGATSASKRRGPTEGTDSSPSNRPCEPDQPIPSTPNPAAPVARVITSAPKRCATIGRAIPARIRRRVWERDQGCCSYEDPVSGRRCASRHLLQVDHIHPYALGGSTELQNLRLLCFAHHRQRHAAGGQGERPPVEGLPDARKAT